MLLILKNGHLSKNPKKIIYINKTFKDSEIAQTSKNKKMEIENEVADIFFAFMFLQ